MLTGINEQEEEDLARDILEGACPKCSTELMLRLPPEMETGRFMVECHRCGKRLHVEVEHDQKGNKRLKIEGKRVKPPERFVVHAPSRPVQRPRKYVVETVELPFTRRLRTVSVLLVIVGLLGIISSIMTLAGAFSIKDLEEQSPNDHATFSVWVLDYTTGRGIKDVNVTISSTDSSFQSTTDQEGLSVIDEVDVGEVQLILFKDGYQTVSGPITIRKGTPNILDVPMKVGDSSMTNPLPVQQFRTKNYSTLYTDITAVLMMLCSLLAFVGAAFVYKRDFFTLALAASFLSIFSMGFLVGSIIAFICTVLIILSYDGFAHTHHLLWMMEAQAREDLKNIFTRRERRPLGLPPARERR